MTAAEFYPQVVLDHYRHPRNRGALDGCTRASDGANPLCGDRLRIEVRCDGGRVAELRHAGESCAVATATASMLGSLVVGCDADEIAALERHFVAFLEGGDDVSGLGELAAMRALQQDPARRKCALLPWATLRAALAGDARTTTEMASA